jgi:hypothetical protein
MAGHRAKWGKQAGPFPPAADGGYNKQIGQAVFQIFRM